MGTGLLIIPVWVTLINELLRYDPALSTNSSRLNNLTNSFSKSPLMTKSLPHSRLRRGFNYPIVPRKEAPFASVAKSR